MAQAEGEVLRTGQSLIELLGGLLQSRGLVSAAGRIRRKALCAALQAHAANRYEHSHLDALLSTQASVARVLAPGGLWLSLSGSTEGAPRDTGPPRRSARDIANAVECGTHVPVEHRGLEKHPAADALRERIDCDGGWDALLAAYSAAV